MNNPATDKIQHATIMLASGELDKALAAFEIANGLAAMGTQVDMWFVMYGVNCLKKPRSLFSLAKWLARRGPAGNGRMTSTDTIYQRVMTVLNHDGAPHLPLSQLNYLGAGPWMLNRILRRKGMATLDKLIQAATRQGISFKICQVCIDVMAINIEEDLLVEAEVFGVSTYVLDTCNSHYNIVI